MNLPDFLSIIANFMLILVYSYLFILFRKRYNIQKKEGYINAFLRGYSFMFLSLFIFQVSSSIINLIDAFLEEFKVTQLQFYFPGKPAELNAFIKFISNLLRPLFILGLCLFELIISAQVYPLEKALNWKKVPGVKFMIITALSLFLLFIPAITWTNFGAVLIYASVAGILYGFGMNILINIKLAFSTVGDVKRRSTYIIFASFLLYFGFVWYLQVGWTEILIPSLTDLSWDVVFGAIMIIISALLYRTGLAGRIIK